MRKGFAVFLPSKVLLRRYVFTLYPAENYEVLFTYAVCFIFRKDLRRSVMRYHNTAYLRHFAYLLVIRTNFIHRKSFEKKRFFAYLLSFYAKISLFVC